MNHSMTRDPGKTGRRAILADDGWNKPSGRRLGSRRRRPLNWFWLLTGWLALLPVMVVLILRWQALDTPLSIAIAGLTPFLAVPLVIAVFSSWWSRSATLRVVAAVTAAGFLFTTSPVDAVIGCRGTTANDAITIYTANVLGGGGRPADVATSILAEDADVFTLQEVQWPFLQALRNDPRLAEYRYHSDDEPGDWSGTIVWSKWPFVDVELEPFEVASLIHTTVAGPTGEFTITGLHTLAPIRQEFVGSWHRQFEQLSRIDTSSPRMLAGDFNATSDHQQFRQLLSSGWTDVHDRKGCGLDTTWPVGSGLPVPLMRLDHVLVSDHFDVLDVHFADPAGSDHKPVVTSIRLN
ncbi:MAG: endonuclease/exonuclease/phosphatase family protein [Acidimicrobiales bacterium]